MEFDKTRKYYVYAWKIKGTGEVFYIGKGSGNRYKTKKRENSYFTKMVMSHDCEPEILINDLTEAEAFEYEKVLIAVYRTSCPRLTNVLDGGEQPPSSKGKKRSEETKRKMSGSMKKYFANHPEAADESSKRLKEFLKTEKGKEFARKSAEARATEEFKQLHSRRCRAANTTPEYLEKQSALVKKMWESKAYTDAHSGANNCRAQSVEQYDSDGNYIKSYETITQAANETGVNFSKISAVCRGKRKTAGGYIWKYPNGEYKPLKKARKNVYDPSKDRSAKAVLKCDYLGNVLAEYHSTSEAARQNPGTDRSGIIANLRGRTKRAYGFVWKYK